MLSEVTADHDAYVDFCPGVPGVNAAVASTIVAGEDRVLRILHGGGLRYFGRTIASLDRKTLTVAGYRQ